MPENDAEARSRERREEAQQQQELLNSIRDNNSIFRQGQMEGDNAKDWMSRNPGDAFQNIVKILKEHHSALSKLIRLNNGHTRKINDINDNLIKIDDRTDRLEKNVADKFKSLKKMSVWAEQYSKQTSKKFDQHVHRLDQQEKLIRDLQEEKRDLESDQGSMMEDIIELQKQYSTLISTLAAKEGSVGVKLIRKGSIKKSKKKSKKKKSTKRKGSKKRR